MDRLIAKFNSLKSGKMLNLGKGFFPLFILAVIFTYFAVNWVAEALIHQRITVQVPQIEGKPLAEALDMLAAQRLPLLKEAEQYEQNLPAGFVIKQVPAAGTSVREGRVVRIFISKGGEVVSVPNVEEMPLRLAEITIRQSGLEIGEESTACSLRFAEGRVIRQEPAAGEFIGKGMPVNIVISSGEPPPDSGISLLPDFRGQLLFESQLWAVQNGVEIILEPDNSSTANPGTILEQNPPYDTELIPGVALRLKVSRPEEILETDKHWFSYTLPSGEGEKEVKIIFLDTQGEEILYQRRIKAGSRINLPLAAGKSGRLRIFIDGILIEEQEWE